MYAEDVKEPKTWNAGVANNRGRYGVELDVRRSCHRELTRLF